MSTMNYTEYGLAPWILFENVGEDFRAEKPIQFNVVLRADGDRVILEYELPDEPGQDYITITCNSTVQITLKSDQLWFSKEFEGITTKEPLSSFYGSVEYVEDSYDKCRERYKSLRFKARYNKGGKFNTCHRFNINVDLLQVVGETERWIGLTIDPDIKNPPPQGGG